MIDKLTELQKLQNAALAYQDALMRVNMSVELRDRCLRESVYSMLEIVKQAVTNSESHP